MTYKDGNPETASYPGETLPPCDICKIQVTLDERRGPPQTAVYDGATVGGPWGYMCEEHFKTHGMGLGLGRGQRLVLDPASGDDVVFKCEWCGLAGNVDGMNADKDGELEVRLGKVVCKDTVTCDAREAEQAARDED